MNSLILFFESAKGQKVKNLIIGLGAAVVILGALFKLMSWPGSGGMLIAGLGTEAFLFTLLGFLPPHPDLYWEKFYPGITVSPELEEHTKEGHELKPEKSVTEQLNEMIEESNIDKAVIERLGNNLGRLGETVSKISDVSDASAATTQYSEEAKAAASALAEMRVAYTNATASVNSLSSTTDEFKGYQDQVQAAAQSLASLNQLYESELSDTASNLKSLNSNLSALNNVYGNMLTAMGRTSGGQG